VVRLLLVARANATGAVGICCLRGHHKALQLLLEAGAAMDRCNSQGETTLWLACEHGHVEAARLLLQNGAGRGPSQHDCKRLIAAHGSRLQIQQLLREAGTGTDWNNHVGELLLWLSCEDGQADMVRQLLTEGARVDWSNGFGETLLGLARENGHEELMHLLTAASSDADAPGLHVRHDGYRTLGTQAGT
ncbi:ANKRD17, partial [Symbiodinium pilosum]